MTVTFAQPNLAEPKRDRWGRPLIVPLDGGEPVAYTRVSTMCGLAEDTSNLTKWKMRTVAHGLGLKPDLVSLAIALDPDSDKKKLDDLCEQAMAAADSSKGANLGTAIHTFTEWADTQGADLSRVPSDIRPLIELYLAEMKRRELTVMAMERFVVNDELKVAGSFDRLLFQPLHGIVVGDLKTGQHDAAFPAKVAIQVAIYANSQLYDVETGTRTPIPGLNRAVGVLMHLNRIARTCESYPLDLIAGWEGAHVAADVHAWRKRKNLLGAWT